MPPYLIHPLHDSDGILIKTPSQEIVIVAAHIPVTSRRSLVDWLREEWKRQGAKCATTIVAQHICAPEEVAA